MGTYKQKKNFNRRAAKRLCLHDKSFLSRRDKNYEHIVCYDSALLFEKKHCVDFGPSGSVIICTDPDPDTSINKQKKIKKKP
jgi:hypothetical protein